MTACHSAGRWDFQKAGLRAPYLAVRLVVKKVGGRVVTMVIPMADQ